MSLLVFLHLSLHKYWASLGPVEFLKLEELGTLWQVFIHNYTVIVLFEWWKAEIVPWPFQINVKQGVKRPHFSSGWLIEGSAYLLSLPSLPSRTFYKVRYPFLTAELTGVSLLHHTGIKMECLWVQTPVL